MNEGTISAQKRPRLEIETQSMKKLEMETVRGMNAKWKMSDKLLSVDWACICRKEC